MSLLWATGSRCDLGAAFASTESELAVIVAHNRERISSGFEAIDHLVREYQGKRRSLP